MNPTRTSLIEKLLSADIRDEALLLEQLKQLIEKFETPAEEPLPQARSWKQLVEEVVAYREQHLDDPEVFFSGWTCLDQLTRGFRRGDFVIVGGRPAMGKTISLATLALQLDAVHKETEFEEVRESADLLQLSLGMVPVTKQKKRIPISSLFCSTSGDEMGFCQLLYYILVNNSIPIHAANDIDFLRKMKDELSKALKNRELHFVRPKSLNIDVMIRMFEEQLAKHPYQAIFIDSIQDIVGGPSIKFRAEQLESICRKLKMLAEKHRICIFASSQLNRSVELRSGSKHPELSDLRDSGSLEEYADKVILLYRPEYYGFSEDADGRSTRGLMELIVAKNLTGASGKVAIRQGKGKGVYNDCQYEEDYITLPKDRLPELGDLIDDLF